MVHLCMLFLTKIKKSSTYPTHLSLSLVNSTSYSLGEINVEPLIRGGPSNSMIALDTLKKMALFLSSRNVSFSFNYFKISILLFQLDGIILLEALKCFKHYNTNYGTPKLQACTQPSLI